MNGGTQERFLRALHALVGDGILRDRVARAFRYVRGIPSDQIDAWPEHVAVEYRALMLILSQKAVANLEDAYVVAIAERFAELVAVATALPIDPGEFKSPSELN